MSPALVAGLCALGLLNLVSFAAFGLDKRRARQRPRRVPESTLCWLPLLGRAAGARVAVHVLRHKPAKTSFRLPLSAATVGCLLRLAAPAWWLRNRERPR